jgi:CSL zinc finger
MRLGHVTGGQALKDPQQRAQYDRSLAAGDVGQRAAAIWQELDLAEFTPCAAPEGSGFLFSFQCRCGGSYLFAESDLAVDACSALVPCDTCSLAVRVLYTVA